jgi:MSHA biogenesis protein MshO
MSSAVIAGGAIARRLGGPYRAGFTLIELVIVLVLAGVLSGLFAGVILRPVEGQIDVARRAALVDGASGALERIARDVRVALPNSVRVSADGRSIELLRTSDAGRYRSGPGTNPGGADHTAISDWLDFAADDSFDVLGRFANLGVASGSALAAGSRLAIYTTDGSTWSDAASSANPGVITPSTLTITLADATDEDRLVLSAPFTFRFSSPRQRVYVVSGPVSYVCDAPSDTLVRVDGYSASAVQPTDPTSGVLALGNVATLTEDVSDCAFSYDPGTASRGGLLTVDLTLTRASEEVRLLQQVHVEGSP